jgi:hypothetical protein
MTDAEAPREIPLAQMPPRTLVVDEIGGQLLWIDGVLMLPPGSRIELAEPKADGIVTAVRLSGAWAGGSPLLVLTVRITEPGGI